MITFVDRDIVFLDCETLGLEREAPIWEFAAIRLRGREIVDIRDFFVRHARRYGTASLPESFAADYRARYRTEEARSETSAALGIQAITDGAIIAGSNPSFDMDRLEILLRSEGLTPGWHHHPLDIPSMVVGQVARSVAIAADDLVGDLKVALPWNSNQLSRRLGVDPDNFARHTAMGDVQWCLAQWRAMNGEGDRS
jgi:DNA polymerase III epsilon subunit-like protein